MASPSRPRRLVRSVAAPLVVARRRLLQWGVVLGAALGLRATARAAPVDVAGLEALAPTFAAFCDTLVPADELTPAASAFGIPAKILDDVRGDADAERLVQFGCAWLDAACGGSFADANEDTRVRACEVMQALPWTSPQGRFFFLLRNTVLGEYYAHPEAWRGLALDRPPQPLGFMEAVRDGR